MTWLELPTDSPFGVHNLPYGVFSTPEVTPRCGVRIGEHVLDLAAVLDDEVFARPALNGFLARGRAAWQRTRARVRELLTDPVQQARVEPHLYGLAGVRLHLPFEVADYVDFYASEHHASNVGRIFRPDAEPLTPNWKHLPIGYHGRSGTVVVSGTDIARPNGQRKPRNETLPTFGPSRRLDFEAEVGFVVGTGSAPGRPIGVDEFADHVFGVCLVNDWSARDIQAWEYVPLGPMLGKSFGTSVSPWVVPLDALDQARIAPPARDHELMPYLTDGENWSLDLTLEVRLNGTTISRPPFAAMYWTPAQMLSHLTVNGATARTGDLYASGTVSGAGADQRGSMLELSWGGANSVPLDGGEARTFLEDGDEVVITGTAPAAGGVRVGLGEVTGRIVSG